MNYKHSADTLAGFFDQLGRGFYIPHYQRNYSWDDENAEKLISDVVGGVKRVFKKENNSVFLGTVILHDLPEVVVDTHADTPNLLTAISNVVDGQQRITSIALLGCVISQVTSDLIDELKSLSSSSDEVNSIIQELEDQFPELTELYSVETRKKGAQPKIKPIIIRAGDMSMKPATDQWTKAGDPKDYYQSSTASFLSDFINGVPLLEITTDERVGGVVRTFYGEILEALNACDSSLVSDLLTECGNNNSSLYNFMAYPPDLGDILALSAEEQTCYYKSVFLLAVCNFLKNSCSFVVIKCTDESIAFDMFQALNATGTPLTAFEVFKPVIVKEYGINFAASIKSEVDRIEKVFEKESSASGKEELTDRVILSSAMVYEGEALGNKFSEERDWLIDTFPLPVSSASKEFISCIADQAEYRDQFIRPRRSKKDSNNFSFVSHLHGLGLDIDQADISSLCIFYLRDAGHQFAHSVISVFYGKLLKAQDNLSAKKSAASEFTSVCKAVAAFFTFWMGAFAGRFPDSVYRRLFQAADNISVANGKSNQTETFVKEAFRKALAAEGIYDASNTGAARTLWVGIAKEKPWYLRKSVCKFALFVSAHDAAPDLTPGHEGLFVDGKPNSSDMLNCRSWHSSEFEVIEHVATRDRPSNIRFGAHFDSSIYPGNQSVVDKIGNLTLLSVRVNSSVYSEWPDKVFYYWNLTTPQSTVHGPDASSLQAALGISKLPPSLAELSAASNHLHYLAPLAHRGIKGLRWDSGFIEERSKHLCERVFDKLDGWLR